MKTTDFSIRCDECGTHPIVAYGTPQKMEAAAIGDGWVWMDGLWWCPSCRRPVEPDPTLFDEDLRVRQVEDTDPL